MVSLSAYEIRDPGSIPMVGTYFQRVFSSYNFSILKLNYFIENGIIEMTAMANL